MVTLASIASIAARSAGTGTRGLASGPVDFKPVFNAFVSNQGILSSIIDIADNADKVLSTTTKTTQAAPPAGETAKDALGAFNAANRAGIFKDGERGAEAFAKLVRTGGAFAPSGDKGNGGRGFF